MIYKEIPENFNPKFEVVSCYLEHNGNILMLHRNDTKPEGNTWGLPAGKLDGDENIMEAMAREIFEETGYETELSELKYLDKVYVKYPDYSFVYHMFKIILDSRPEIKVSPKEHKNYQWVTPQEALNLNYIEDLDACIKLSYGI